MPATSAATSTATKSTDELLLDKYNELLAAIAEANARLGALRSEKTKYDISDDEIVRSSFGSVFAQFMKKDTIATTANPVENAVRDVWDSMMSEPYEAARHYWAPCVKAYLGKWLNTGFTFPELMKYMLCRTVIRASPPEFEALGFPQLMGVETAWYETMLRDKTNVSTNGKSLSAFISMLEKSDEETGFKEAKNLRRDIARNAKAQYIFKKCMYHAAELYWKLRKVERCP